MMIRSLQLIGGILGAAAILATIGLVWWHTPRCNTRAGQSITSVQVGGMTLAGCPRN